MTENITPIEKLEAAEAEETETTLSFAEFVDEKADVSAALELLFSYSQYDGEHHKTWVLDQIARVLTGDKYEAFIKEYRYGGLTEAAIDQGENYSWDTGVAP